MKMQHARLDYVGVTPEVRAAVDFLVKNGFDDDVKVFFGHDLPYYYGDKSAEVNEKIDEYRAKRAGLAKREEEKILEKKRELLDKAGALI